jgi:hypothetical protein
LPPQPSAAIHGIHVGVIAAKPEKRERGHDKREKASQNANAVENCWAVEPASTR